MEPTSTVTEVVAAVATAVVIVLLVICFPYIRVLDIL